MDRPIFVPEIVTPGNRIVGIGADEAFQLSGCVYVLKAHLETAAIALMMFERASAEMSAPDPTSSPWGERREELFRQAIQESSPTNGHEFIRARLTAEMQAKRELWSSGRMPESWKPSLRRLYAREFVYALDGITKMLDRMTCEPGAPTGVDRILDDLEAAIPGVKDTRDSLHHVEDRIRGRGRNERPIPSNGVVIECLFGSRLAMTAGDGRVTEVDVCRRSLEAAQVGVQKLIGLFDWQGHPDHEPR